MPILAGGTGDGSGWVEEGKVWDQINAVDIERHSEGDGPGDLSNPSPGGPPVERPGNGDQVSYIVTVATDQNGQPFTMTISTVITAPSITGHAPQLSSGSVSSSSPTATTATTSNGDTKDSNGGLSTGGKVGLGVGIPIALILLGLAIFFVLRRKRLLERRHGGVDHSEKVISPSDKQGSILMANQEHDPASSIVYGASSGGSPTHPQPEAQIPIVGVGVVGRSVPHEDELDRPVSPVQPEDLLDQGAVGADGPATSRGVDLEEDREMQWILEEERKAKERREAGRLPTQR